MAAALGRRDVSGSATGPTGALRVRRELLRPLDFPDGASATVTHSDSVGKAVIETHGHAPAAGRGWSTSSADQPGAGDGSAGLMPVVPTRPWLLSGDAASATGAGITVEPEGGSPEPTTEPIALFAFDA